MSVKLLDPRQADEFHFSAEEKLITEIKVQIKTKFFFRISWEINEKFTLFGQNEFYFV